MISYAQSLRQKYLKFPFLKTIKMQKFHNTHLGLGTKKGEKVSFVIEQKCGRKLWQHIKAGKDNPRGYEELFCRLS